MKIVVAGAGAGKTTSMAQLVLDKLEEVNTGKFIYVITYTNAARNRIREKIIELNGCIPNQLFIETIHVFLLREFVLPFHHLLYNQQFIKASQMKLPDNLIFKSRKIKELADNKIVHVEKVTEIAKWIICKKTKDTIQIKEKRRNLLDIVSRYLDSIFIDEAQDMDKHLLEVVQMLDRENIDLYLVGDPKQDLRGRDAFKTLIEKYRQSVEYLSENHRCPISHVQLANSYISAVEQQLPQKALLGELGYVFESDIEINSFVNTINWDYAFIYKKNDRFITHINDKNWAKENLAYELKSIINKSNINVQLVDKIIYDIQKIILKDLSQLNNFKVFSMLEKSLSIKLTRQDKGKLADAINLNREIPTNEGILVNSIDSIKGLEGNKCLFILSTDLAPYLFGENGNQNKMLNYLYVALTRAKQKLVFMITTEVEEKYSRKCINTYFQENLLIKEERTREATLT